MEQSKFIRTLRRLNKHEQQRYLDFLQSPYFNKNEDISRFAALVLQRKTPINQQKIYSSLYPGKTFDARRIPDLMYKSLGLLEEFLSEEQYGGQSWERKLNLLSYIRVNELDDLNSVIHREIHELSSKKQFRDSNYFYEEFMYQSEAYKIFLDRSQIKGDDILQKKVDQLDLFYLSAKLRDSCEMMNRKRILAIDYEFHLLDDLINNIQANLKRYEGYPAISIYYHILLMLREPEITDHFNVLKNEIQEHIQLFAQDEQRSLYGYLQNYCILKVNTGVSEFYRELLNIYQHMMGIKLMVADNKNLQWDLKNMVSVALRLEEYDWTFNTINEIKNRLPEEIRENSYTYNLANYYYETKNYKKATRLLQAVDFKDIYYNLDSKSMLLKIYFEQEEEESFLALVAAFKTYLTRNKLISVDRYHSYHNFLKFSRKAFVFKTGLPYEQKRNSNKIKLLKDKLLQTKNVVNLNWLIKEMEGLLKD